MLIKHKNICVTAFRKSDVLLVQVRLIYISPDTIMHHVFIFQLRYTDISLSTLHVVGLNNYFERRCMLQERSLILVRTFCECIKPYLNLYQALTSQNILINATGNSSFTYKSLLPVDCQ